MAAFGSNEELIYMLNLYNSNEYVDYNFISWLYFYPNIFKVMLDPNYNQLFDNAIRKNMDQVLRTIIRNNDFYIIYELEHKYTKEIFDNVDVILDEDKYYYEHFCDLVGFNGFEKCASEKQEKILKKALEFDDYKSSSDYTSNLLFLLSSLPFFSSELANQYKEEIEQFLIKHFNTIDPQCYGRDLLFLFKTIIMSSENHAFINDFFSNHLEFIALVFANQSLETLKREKILDFYVELIKDAIRIENASLKDMSLKSGDNSRTLIIKDKVLKSGHKWTKNIPYHKRILQPIVRQSIDSLDVHTQKELDFVEVYERVGNLNYDDQDLVYEVFKEMLDDGIIFSDPNVDNMGVLLKPNKAFHELVDTNNDNFYIDNEAVGMYDTTSEKEILDTDKIVVRDVDCLYYFENIRDFIISKIQNGEKVTASTFAELEIDCEIFHYGAYFEQYLERYCSELKTSLDNFPESVTRRS